MALREMRQPLAWSGRHSPIFSWQTTVEYTFIGEMSTRFPNVKSLKEVILHGFSGAETPQKSVLLNINTNIMGIIPQATVTRTAVAERIENLSPLESPFESVHCGQKER